LGGKPVRIIDAHVHLFDEPGYVDNLLSTMDACDIERCCISGLGPLFRMMGNEEVKAASEDHPDRFVGAFFVRPGIDEAGAIDAAHGDGFRMVKVTVPRGPYDDPSFHPLWERAQALEMPVLFHTGVVTTATEAPGEHISSWDMHPMRLEPVSRDFPDLGIILAHLGIHWNADAAEVARMRPNVFVDLSGEPGGWRARADADGMDTWLWWPNAFDKVVFGTDVHYGKMKQALQEDAGRLERLGIHRETRERIFSGNILRLLGEGLLSEEEVPDG
jgi:predicted TIM-barrel fold metal-dependent hydrolase